MKIEAKFRLLSAARLVDGLGGPVRERAAVLLEDNKITQVGTEETVSVPEGVPVQQIDFGERTILTGWWTVMFISLELGMVDPVRSSQLSLMKFSHFKQHTMLSCTCTQV